MKHLRSVVLALSLLTPPTLGAQRSTGAFVARLGADTIAVERYTRTATTLEGDVASRVPRTRTFHYVATLNPDGTIGKADVTITPAAPPAGAPAGTPVRAQKIAMTFGAETTLVTLSAGDSTRTMKVATGARALPLISYSYGLYEQGVLHARTLNRDTVGFSLVAAGNPTPFPMNITRTGPRTVDIDYFGLPMHATLDSDGRILSLDGTGTTIKVLVERVADFDVAGFAQRSGARDAGGQALGQLSPRDSVHATVGNAHLIIDYGRPLKRGRAIVGGVVPYDQVWRTGANAATGFSTDADVVIGGTPVPAGKYTLWTLPSKSGVLLIVNKQTGQWGTVYDPKQDLVRIPMQAAGVSSPVEQFTIAMVPEGNGASLRMTWDSAQWSVPIVSK